MSQLEQALDLLADRAEPIPIDVLLWRLEVQLATDGTATEAGGNTMAAESGYSSGPNGFVQRRGRGRWRGPLVAAGAAAAVIVLIAGVAWLMGRGGSEIVDEPTPVTTTTPPGVPDDIQPAVVNTLPMSSAPAPIDVTSGVVVTDGMLWATTQAGIVRWDLEARTSDVFTSTDGLPVTTGGLGQVAVAPDGTVWAYSWTQDVVMFDGNRWSEPDGYNQVDVVNPRCVFGEECLNPITALAFGLGGRLSLAVGPETLLQYDGSDWNVLPVSDAETHGDGAYAWATDIAVATDGTLWIASWEELLRYDGTTWERFTAADGLPKGAINSVAAAPNGDVWVGTTDDGEGGTAGGAGRFDGAAWTIFDTADGLYDNAATALEAASDGTVWVVHSAVDAPAADGELATGGISRFDGSTWSSTSIADVGVGFGWGGAAVDDTGTLWITSRWGVVGFDGAEAVVLRVGESGRPEADVPYTVIEGGTDILATTVAKPVEPAAVCPADSRPDTSGPIEQARPPGGSGSWLGAAMDIRSGRIVAVADAGGGTETWTFDVCANTWTLMQPTGWSPSTGVRTLVYDADSDVVVAIGQSVGVYDADADTWMQRDAAPSSSDWLRNDAVYDPVSGLIVVRLLESSEMWAYDVDGDNWTQIRQGAMSPPGDPAMSPSTGPSFSHQHFAYEEAADRIVLYVGDNSSGPGVWDGAGTEMTWTYDLRGGEWTVEDAVTPELSAGWFSFGLMVYDEVARRTIIPADGVVAGYDARMHEWEILWESPSETNAYGFGTGVHNRIGASVVYDSINDRVVVIGGDARMLDEEPFWVAMDDVWAFDTGTATWSELLAPSSP
jgi:hypothetical protein